MSLESLRIGLGQHVAFLHAAEAFDHGPVERHSFFEGVLKLGRSDAESFRSAEHVGEPQLNEAHASLFNCAQYVILRPFHRDTLVGREPGSHGRSALRPRVYIELTKLLGSRPDTMGSRHRRRIVRLVHPEEEH